MRQSWCHVLARIDNTCGRNVCCSQAAMPKEWQRLDDVVTGQTGRDASIR